MTNDRIEKAELEEKALIREFFSGREQGVFVEVGANQPTSVFSQTWHLEQLGWSGVLVEPNETLYRRCVAQRPRSRSFQAACSSPDKVGTAELKIPYVDGSIDTGKAALETNIDHGAFDRYEIQHVEVTTLDAILEQCSIEDVDFVSIDVEGTELDVLLGFNLEKYRPRLVLLEDRCVYLGKHRYFKRHGYKLVKRTGFNNWYVPKDSSFKSAAVIERLKLFRKLYIGLLPRKIKEALTMRNIQPLIRL